MSNIDSENQGTQPEVTTEANEQVQASDIASVEFTYVNPNVLMTKSPFKEGTLKKQTDALPLTSFGLALTNLRHVQQPNTKLLRDADPKWGAAYGQSYVDNVSNIFLDQEPTIQLERAMATGIWRQNIEHNGVQMQTDSPRIEPATSGDRLTGTAALSKLNMLLGGGKYIRVPLWASGFWITLTAPTNNDLLNLNIALEEKKGHIGRATAGAAFSNRQALMVETIFEFVKDHIYDTTIRNWTDEDLSKLVKSVDLYPLIHAMSVAIFPDGFSYQIPCVYRPTDCNYIRQCTLNLAKMFWTDNTKINTHQSKFMYESLNKARTVEEIRRYQDDMALTKDNRIEINERITAVLRISSVADVITSGSRWIDDVTKIVDRLAFDKANESERQYLLHSHMMITSIREYSHYVERFILTDVNDQQQYIDEANTIESSIATIAADNEFSETFTNGISKFIERNIVTVVGTPNFQCPDCGKLQTVDDSLHPLIVTFDPLVVFTTLMDRRLSLIGK